MGSSLVFTIALIAASSFTIAIAFYSWKSRTIPAAAYLAGINLAASIYSIGYAFELSSTTLPSMLFWSRFQYLGISFVPPFWLLFIAAYAGKKNRVRPSIRTAMFVLSGLTLLFHWTQSYHRLYYVHPRIDTAPPFPLLAFDKGPWYWVHQAYANVVLLVSVVFLLGMFRRASSTQRRQTVIVLAGTALPWLSYLVYLSGLGPRDIDLTPFGLALASPIFAWAVFRLKLLDLVPIARESVFESMRDGAIVVDRAGRILDFNPAAKRIFPNLSRNSIGQGLAEAVPGHPEILGVLKVGGSPEAEIRTDSGEGTRFYLARQSPIMSRRRLIGFSIMIGDTTPQNMLREQLRAQATIDDLTGAFNRRHFLETGRRELARAKRYRRAISAMIVDLDNFKKINDTWGHEAGDQVLAAAVETLRKGLRTSDVLGRHGGEEFAIILPETPPGQAAAVAERFRQALTQTEVKLAGGTSLGFTASFGVAGTEVVGNELLDDLIRAADRAMYVAKEAGRNCVRCAPSLHTVKL